MSFPPYEIYKSTEYDWLGTIPTSWRTQKFRHLFKESSEKIEGEVFGEMLSVSGYRGIQRKEYDDENRRRSEEDLVGYRIVRKGQLVVNTMWLNYAGLGFSELDGHVSPAYRSYWPKSDEYSKYLHYLLRSEHYVNGYTRLLTGVRPNSLQMSRDNMMSFPVVLPPKAEQIAIATFLDRETAKIDALIAEQKRLIELLQEKKQAVISHAVTKGLNPDAPMKESGVEWLGEVPEHWEVKRVRRIFEIKKRIVGELGFEVLSITQQGIKVRDPESNEGQVSMDYSKYQLVNTGDFAMNHMDLLTGFVDISSRLGVTSPDYRVFSVSRPLESNAEYLLYIFQMGYRQKILYAYGQGSSQLGRWRLPTEAFKNWSIPFPSREEQIFITLYLDRVTAKIVALITEQQRLIELLQERRSALISAAVTGQIDVRGLVEVGASEQ